MKLHHLDLQVTDVQATIAFFETFGLAVQSSRSSSAMAILSDGSGFVLVVQRKKPEQSYPKNLHLGFLVDDEVTVERMHARLVEQHVTVSDVDRNRHGAMIYARLEDGILIEVSCRKTV